MKRLIPVSLLAALIAASAALLMSTNAQAAQTVTVPVGDLWFCNASFQNGVCTTTIGVGDTVLWDFGGASAIHTATSDTSVWDSGNINPGGSFQFTFTQAGSFAYHCAIHPAQMKGVIVVQAAAASPTSPPAGQTPAPGATSTPRAGGTLPTSGQGPRSGSGDWWLLAALAAAGAGSLGLGIAYRVRAR